MASSDDRQTDATQKSFDCVAFMREARSELSEKMSSMSSEEFRDWMRHKEYSDRRRARLAHGFRQDEAGEEEP